MQKINLNRKVSGHDKFGSNRTVMLDLASHSVILAANGTYMGLLKTSFLLIHRAKFHIFSILAQLQAI